MFVEIFYIYSTFCFEADKKSPFFATDYKLTEQRLCATFEALKVNLHQEALMDLQKFGNELSKRLAEVQKQATPTATDEELPLKRWSSKVSLTPSMMTISSTIKEAQKPVRQEVSRHPE